MKKENPNLKAIKLLHSFSPRYFLSLVLSSLIRNLGPYFNLFLSAEIINEIAGNRNINTLTTLITITIVGNLIIAILGSVASKWFSVSETVLSDSETRHYLQKLLEMDYTDLENPNVRQLRRKIEESARINSHGRRLLTKSIGRIVDAFTGMIGISILFVSLLQSSIYGVPPSATLVFLAVICVLLTTSVLYNMRTQVKYAKAANEVSKTMTDNNRVDNAIENYNIGKDVRLFRQDVLIMNIKETRRKMHREAFEKFSTYQMNYGIPVHFLTFALNLTVYVYIVYNVLCGCVLLGDAFKYVGFTQKIIESILGAFHGVADIRANTRYVNEYLEYLNIPQLMRGGTRHIRCGGNGHVIKFCNVSFKYPSSNEYALRNINIEINAKECIGIVGQNGSGKSTFIKLLCRLYDPTEGEIYFDGVNIKEYNYQEYLSVISVVFQDFKLLPFSLGQNISSGEIVQPKEVEECLKNAGFVERLQKMQNGIETYLYRDFDNEGVEISGGEAQQIALARALYKKAPILIMDEPTASLDPFAEQQVYSKISTHFADKTTVFISHRLSSCRFCDRIFVFRGGSIVQLGSHESLIKDISGDYYSLWKAQAQYYVDEV